MKRLFLLVLFCPLMLFSADARKPNIVFILIDDMGWSDLGCTGSDLFQTPNIDKLAARGMRFTNAYSTCTVCSPTRASILTGQYPARLHLTDWIPGHERPKAPLKIPDWTQKLTHDQPTIAELLKRSGYVSASIGKWHLGKEFPTDFGFDLNVGGCHMGQPPSYFAPYKIPTMKEGPDGEYLTDRQTDEACRFIESSKDKPFFLYFPYYCVHTPLQAKKALIEEYAAKIKPDSRHKNAKYAAMIQTLDKGIGKLLAKLDELKIADNTIVIFTSDNGGLLQSTSNVPLRAGKGSAYEGGVRVPLIVLWPGVTPAGSLCEEPVISVDHVPTLMELAQVEVGQAQICDGVSLTPLLRNPKEKLKRDAIFWHYPHYHPGGATPYSAVRAGDWRLVEFFTDNHVELYNLKDDVGEKNDLSEKMPEKTSELRKKLAEWRQSVGAQLPTKNADHVPGAPEKKGQAMFPGPEWYTAAGALD
ncbi:MAG TPA: sulfatase [Planctomycetota bacterium]|jgi:arylsulfatase A-like enzyme